MKKILISVAIFATMAMAACQPTAKKAEDEGAAIKAKIENCSDPDSLKIYIQQAKDYADKLVKEGDDEAAKAYLSEVDPVIKTKDPSAADFFKSLTEKADSAVTATEDSLKAKAAAKADDLKENVKDAAKDAVDKGKDAAKDAVDKGKEAANDAVNKGKDAAKDAVNKGKDAANSALDKAKDALKK